MNFLSKKFTKIKFSFVDYTTHVNDWKLIMSEYNRDYLYLFGHVTLPNIIAVDILPKKIKRWKKLIESGKKVAFITGAEKPMLRCKGSSWIFNFHDGFVGYRMSTLRQMYDDGSFGSYEFFYWSPDFPKIPIKQSHCIMNHYKKNIEKLQQDTIYVNPEYGRTFKKNQLTFSPIVYPSLQIIDTVGDCHIGLDGRKYYIKKNDKVFYGNRDQWYFNSNLESKQNFNDLLKSVKNVSNNFWLNDLSSVGLGIKNCISKDYFLC